jgi:SAM-dependent methyltransferase
MSDVFPTGTSVDSEFLFRRMAEATLDALETRPGSRVVDVAAGVGQDDRALARRGAWVVGAEPSERMTALAYLSDREDAEPPSGGVARVRAWSEALPFGAGAFDGAFCKGALDHFDDPESCIREMARVTRASGRVVSRFGSRARSSACAVPVAAAAGTTTSPPITSRATTRPWCASSSSASCRWIEPRASRSSGGSAAGRDCSRASVRPGRAGCSGSEIASPPASQP